MINPIASAATATREQQQLKKACEQLESVFMNELMKNMRATIQKEGVVDGGSGEDTFTAMLDEHIAGLGVTRGADGIAQALYNQLRQRLAAQP
jgi:peptidoglycan hydrolase FlgJ